MSYSVKVASITTPYSKRPNNLQFPYKLAEEWVERIKTKLDLTEIPWEEPSELKGIDSSISASRYAAFIHLFKSYGLNFPQLFQVKAEEKLFIPASFSTPIFFSDNNDTSVAVGSSLELINELYQANAILEQKISRFGADEIVDAPYTWEALKDACDVLLIAANESQELNLPIKILW